MLYREKKLNILDILIVCVLFITGCFGGKLVTENVEDTWIAFNGPAIGALLIGELVWWRIRKKLIKKWEED